MMKKFTVLTMLLISCLGFAQTNNCATAPTDCNLVYNGDFEQNSGIPSANAQLQLACNWESIRNTPDYFHVNATQSNPTISVDIPTNSFGSQNVFNGGQAYGGYVIDNEANSNFYENLRTKLVQPLAASKTYRLTLNISKAEGMSTNQVLFQAYLGWNNLTFSGGVVNEEVNGILLTGDYVTNTSGWDTVTLTFTTGSTAGQEYLYLGAFDVDFQNGNPTEKVYYYVDNVNLVEVQNFTPQLSLPVTPVCATSANLNLATYLSNGVTGGVFSGPGVSYAGGVYTFSPATAGAGTHTITYTIPSPIACPPVVVTDIIKVNGCTAVPYITQTYVYGGDRYVEIKNPGPGSIGGIGPKFYMALYKDGATTPVATPMVIPIVAAGAIKAFKLSTVIDPAYASLAPTGNGQAFALWPALSDFDGDGDIVIISRTNGATAFADRVDIFGTSSYNSANTSMVRTSCSVAPKVTFDEQDWVAFTDEEVAQATSKTNAVLGRHFDDQLVYSATGWADISTDESNPDRSRTAVIDANYTTGVQGSFEACSLLVNSYKTLTINSSDYAKIQTSVDVADNGNLIIENGGSLVQVRDQYYGVAGTDLINLGTTNSIMKATKTTVNLDSSKDYMYWSSPLSTHPTNPKLNQIFSFGNGIGQVNPATFFLFRNEKYCDIYHRFSGISGATDDYDDNYDVWDATNTTTEQNAYMMPGKGYVTYPKIPSSTDYNYSVDFIGEMNNGVVSVPVYKNNSLNGDNFNIVGNPYPSAIDLDVFFAENSTLIEPFALFWSRVNDNLSASNPGPGAQNYSAGNFALYTTDMSLITGEYGTYMPGKVTASGQSFQIRTYKNFTGFTNGAVAPVVATPTPALIHPNEEIIQSGNLVFKNNMRTTLPNTVLMRTAATEPKSTEQGDKLWVNLSDDNNYEVQLGIYFKPTGSAAYKQGEDITSIHGRKYNFYTQSTSEDLIIDIQDGFKTDKVIPLGIYNVSGKTNRNFTISIPKTGGIFNTQTVYLEDRQLGTIHNLSDKDYAFATSENIVEGRFALRFTSTKIDSNEISETTDNEVVAIVSESDVVVKSKSKNIKGLYVSDIYTPNTSGLLLAKADNVNSKTAKLNVPEKYKLLSIKIILEDGSVVSKKIMR